MAFSSEPTHQSGEHKLPIEMRGLIARMEELMNNDQRCNNAALPSQLIMDLITEGTVASFSQFETWLRQMGSRVHLVAVPLDFYGDEWANKTRYPNQAEQKPEYVLWVGVNGDKETEELLSEVGISPEDNLQRLLTTGVLFLEE